VSAFLYGALAAVAATIALGFARDWRAGGDRLLGYFAAAFAVMALNWTAIAAITPTDETRHYLFVPRLVAFGLIIAGIVGRNRRAAVPAKLARTDLRA
jgi:hypothetical protein